MTTTVIRRRAIAPVAPTRAVVRTRRQVSAAARREATQDAATRKPRTSAVTQNLKEREEVQGLLKEYADLSAQVAELTTALRDKAIEVQKTYDDHGLTEAITGYGYRAYMKTAKGRSSTTVDIDALYTYLEEKEDLETFWEIVTAKVADVKGVIPEKEQPKVMTVTPGKDGAPVFTIEVEKK